ncbi:MAG: hypothetical protein KR126chlam4_00238 [Candidatus Anoxychlamydiales bacterium]|nr:hypothetical protein [Candidatus Anoxychlamydiales bacterium]NGX40416.1 hypothetical protein [Candidatus Anoxychlamydiales bacterium]
MKKYSPWFIALFVIILIVVVVWIIKTPIIASYLSNKLKTDVSMSNIAISTKKMEIKNFRIKNPRGSKSRYAFIAKKIEVNYSFSKLMSSPSIVDSILVQDINLDIECSNPLCTKNNWTNIVDNINAKEKKTVSKKEVILKTLSLKNMDVAITGLGLDFNKTKTINVASIEFNNISNKTGFPTQELIAAIFKSAGLKDYLKGILENKGFWESVIKGFKEVGASDNSLEESLKAI